MNLFQRHDCMVAVYVLAALKKFGFQALQWDPVILRDAFQVEFNCTLSQKAFDKLMAGMSMVGTNLFTTSVQVFLSCASLCANKTVRQQQLPYVSLKDCCWAVFMWKDLIGYNPQEDPQRFDPDIIMYIQELMHLQGISQLPQYMQFAKLPDQRLTAIQEALVSDITAFEAYNIRQSAQVAQINAYVKDQQALLVAQLHQMQALLKEQEKLSEIAKK